MEGNSDTTPFWPHPIALPRRRPSRLSRLVSVPIMILIVPVIVVVVGVVFVPRFVYLASRILEPGGGKMSWELFSVLAVLFAVISGIFAERNGGVFGSEDPPDLGVRRRIRGAPVDGVSGGMRRSGGSYSDLRRKPPREARDCDDRFRCFDDFEINKHSDRSAEYGGRSRRRRVGIGEDFDDAKVIPVDTCVLRSSPPASNPPPAKRNYKSVEKTVIVSQNDGEFGKISSPETAVLQREKRIHESDSLEKPVELRKNDAEIVKISSPAAPGPPPPVPAVEKQVKIEGRKSIAMKEITAVLQLASLYNQRKAIDKKPKVKNNRENASDSTHFSITFPPPSPAPPPPPPPVFHNLIKKNWKKIKSLSTPPPPPPPREPPLPSTLGTQTQITPPDLTTLPPPSPAPPPPPLPPLPSVFHNLVKKGLSKSNWNKIKSLSTPPLPQPRAAPPLPSTLETQTQITPPDLTTLPPPSPAPPPPPLPPPPSAFHNLVKKGLTKSNWNKIKSLSTPQPPPPQPNPSRRRNPSASVKPPLIPVPPARIQSQKAVTNLIVREDSVRVQSTQISRCGPHRSGAVDQPQPSDASIASDGRDSVGPVFCPSPDVNVKADTFIARLKDGWRLEKMNSVREKRDVGPGPEIEPGPLSGPK